MRVRIPTPLRSYTGGEANVTAAGATVADVLADLDRRTTELVILRVAHLRGEARSLLAEVGE